MMSKINKTIIIIISLLIPFFVAAQEVYKVDLNTAKDLALKENVQIKNAKADIKISKQKVWETTAIGLPQADASLLYRNNIDIPTTLVPAVMFNQQAPEGKLIPIKFGVTHNATFEFQASQLIFSGEYIVGLQASKTYKFLSEQSLTKTKYDVIENVYQTYYTLLFANQNLEILTESMKDMEVTYNETEQIYKSGLMDKTSLDQLKLNLRSIENSVASLKRQIKTQEKLLKFQMGLDINDSIQVSGDLKSVFDASSVEQIMLKKLDVSENIDYKLIKTQESLQQLSVKREKTAYLPTLSAFYTHQQSGQGDNFDFYKDGEMWFPANIIGASLNIPIFSSGSRYSKVQQSKLELEKISNSKYQLEQSLMLNMDRAKTELINSFETYQKERENMELAEDIYEKGKIKFKAGTISSTEITQLNIQYLTSQTTYYSSILDVLNKKVTIDKLLGKL